MAAVAIPATFLLVYALTQVTGGGDFPGFAGA